ncbi:MAG: leucyl aminopeptidase [Kiritimatiellae bacterium]|nr:leucyl aminopeptidase [Kiritimatiellia bacterium]
MIKLELAKNGKGADARVVLAAGKSLLLDGTWVKAAEGKALATWWAAQGAGKVGRVVWASCGGLEGPVLVVDVGAAGAADAQSWFRSWGCVGKALARAKGVKKVAILLPDGLWAEWPDWAARTAAAGTLFGAYRWTGGKSKPAAKGEGPEVVWAGAGAADKNVQSALARGAEEGFVQCAFRDLANIPAQRLGPEELAAFAKELAEKEGLEFREWDEAALEEAGCGGILGVAQGSARPPRLLRVAWPGTGAGRTRKPIALVGKGVMFDSGGICLKPAKGMEWMQYDKCGAMAVLCAVAMCARLGVEQPVVAWVPCADNMPSGSALRPGDIVTMADGQTVQVVNTDAEGRMLLADALAMAAREEPEAIVDVATLTGAVIIALGHEAAAVMGSDEDLVEDLFDAGAAVGERLWELPLWKEYGEPFESPFADCKNMGDRTAGTIEAAAFLQRFVPAGQAWAHIDIAGTAWWEDEKAFAAPGATLAAARLLCRLVENWE